uniref:Stress response regulator gls24 homolog n=1 Tax=Enterococcus faecalis TaxID=1351 RepID=O32593_ENTFL|nr:gls24 [Enterococcus faecalis]
MSNEKFNNVPKPAGNGPHTPEDHAIKGELTFEDKSFKNYRFSLENVDGLLTVDGGFFSNIAEKLVNTDNVTAGIDTEVGKKQVAVDMDIVVEYGKDIQDIYEKMKELISREVKKMTHLDVIEVNVNVVDIKSKGRYEEDSETVQDKVTALPSTGEFASDNRKAKSCDKEQNKSKKIWNHV